MTEIAYSDGKSTEAEIAAALKENGHVHSLSRISSPRYGDWAFRYHLSPERGNLLRPFSFEGLDVVEFGCGMGAVSRVVAESCQSLYLVEGTQSRFDGASARLKDLTNWSGTVGNFAEVEPTKKFDVVLCMGVLEYAELFMTPPADFDGDAFAFALNRMSRWLKPEGVFVIAIENRLGIKYWTGAGEDHTGLRFDGVCGYPDTPSPRTFSRKELAARLNGAGFGEVQPYFPFPDYKVPHAILREGLATHFPEAASHLASGRPFEDYHRAKKPLLSDPLALRELAHAGLLPDFSNSFLFLASANSSSPTLKQLTAGHDPVLAWHYNVNRHRPTVTRFLKEADGARVEKQELFAAGAKKSTAKKYETVRWFSVNEPLTNEPSLRLTLLRMAFFGERENFLELWKKFGARVFAGWGNGTTLDGKALDTLVTNAVIDGNTEDFVFFDQEWASTTPLTQSFWVLRNALCFAADATTLGQIGFSSLADLYAQLCESLGLTAGLERDLNHEAELQADVTGGATPHLRADLEALLYRAIPRLAWREAEGTTPSIKRSAKELGQALRDRANREWEKREGLRGRVLGVLNPLKPLLSKAGAESPNGSNQ